MHISVEYKKAGEVEIYLDREGLDFLIRVLNRFDRSGKGDHEHLMTPSWAGTELSEDKQGQETELIHHLCLILMAK